MWQAREVETPSAAPLLETRSFRHTHYTVQTRKQTDICRWARLIERNLDAFLIVGRIAEISWRFAVC